MPDQPHTFQPNTAVTKNFPSCHRRAVIAALHHCQKQPGTSLAAPCFPRSRCSRTMLHTAALLAVGLALLAACAAPAAAFSTESAWTDARSTFYGRDGWSVDTGSCGYGFICPNR